MKKLLLRFSFTTIVGALSVGEPAHADDTRVATVDEAMRLAHAQYDEGRYANAFGNFFWAAIRDHAQAQEIVGMMYLLGPDTYGPGVRRDPDEAAFWLAEAGQRGREVARYLDCMSRRPAARQSARYSGATTLCAPTVTTGQ